MQVAEDGPAAIHIHSFLPEMESGKKEPFGAFVVERRAAEAVAALAIGAPVAGMPLAEALQAVKNTSPLQTLTHSQVLHYDHDLICSFDFA